MKKNILTTVATATLFTGLALSSATAASMLVNSGDKTVTDADLNISIDIANQGSKDANMTFIPGIDASPGSSFTMQFVNGGFKGDASITLCNGATKVGNLLTRGTLSAEGLMVNPTFQFDPNADQAKIVQDTNVTFNTDANCSVVALPEIVSSASEPCQAITAQVVDGKSTQGTSFPDYNTAVFKIGTTRQFIKIACSAPECFVSADRHSFLPSSTPAGINVALSPVTGALAVFPDTNATDATCPTCPTATVAGQTTCTTIITLKNDSPETNTDLNITKLDFLASFAGTLGADMNVTIDDNNTASGYILGNKFTAGNIELSAQKEVNLTVVYTLKETNTLELGNVMGTIDGLETNKTVAVSSSFKDKVITEMKNGPQTQFTVPYMNGAVSSMVRVAPVGGVEATLSAKITDSAGNICDVTLDPIPANSSTMVFANSKAGRTAPYQNLIDAGECTNLTTTEYSVVFSTSTAANVVSYMTMSNGSQRYVNVY